MAGVAATRLTKRGMLTRPLTRAISDVIGGETYAAIINDAGELAPYVTFTRSSTATRFNSAGLLETVAANAPRYDYDPVTLQLRGLLIEEQRTNLFTQSATFENAAWVKTNCTISENVATAPDGTLAADKFIPGSGQPAAQTAQTISVSATTAYSFTIRAKAAEQSKFSIVSNLNGVFRACIFDLAAATASPGTGWTASIKAIGGGWYECVATATSDVAGSKVFQISNNSAGWTGDGTSGILVWGAQLEAGAFATSYIPTTTAAVTRAADNAAVSDLSSIGFKASDGTLFGEFSRFGNSASWLAAIHAGANTNTTSYISLIVNSSNIPRQTIVVSGVNQGNMDAGTVTNGALPQKLAGAYKALDAAAVYNGGTPATNATLSLPTVTTMQIGNLFTQYFNGHIRRLRYYPRRLSNAQLQALTA